MSLNADLLARAPWGTWVITTPLAVLTVLGWYGRDLLEFIRVFACTAVGLTDGYDTEQTERRT